MNQPQTQGKPSRYHPKHDRLLIRGNWGCVTSCGAAQSWGAQPWHLLRCIQRCRAHLLGMLLPWMGGSTPGQDPTSDFFTLVCTRGEQGRISAYCVHGEPKCAWGGGVHGACAPPDLQGTPSRTQSRGEGRAGVTPSPLGYPFGLPFCSSPPTFTPTHPTGG